MAIYVPGQSCAICNLSVEPSEDRVLLPPFTTNELDPLFSLSDAVVHADCLRRDSRDERLARRIEDFDASRGQRTKMCAVCGKAITNPDDYFTLGYVGEDELAAKWNYLNFHIECLPLWVELPALIRWTDWAVEHGLWSKYGISWLSEQLKKAAASSPSVK